MTEEYIRELEEKAAAELAALFEMAKKDAVL